jgi:hypothetical protein
LWLRVVATLATPRVKHDQSTRYNMFSTALIAGCFGIAVATGIAVAAVVIAAEARRREIIQRRIQAVISERPFHAGNRVHDVTQAL